MLRSWLEQFTFIGHHNAVLGLKEMSSIAAMETAAEFAARFGRFVDSSPTPYHVCREISARLVGCGFVRLLESQSWKDVSFAI